MTIEERMVQLEQQLADVKAELQVMKLADLQRDRNIVAATAGGNIAREMQQHIYAWARESNTYNQVLKETLVAIAFERGVALPAS